MEINRTSEQTGQGTNRKNIEKILKWIGACKPYIDFIPKEEIQKKRTMVEKRNAAKKTEKLKPSRLCVCI